jgi:hypothetical protein
MAASVSSERAFSQGGITVTKRRNRLKGDIVEALQCVKCAIRHDLLYREPGPSSILEAEMNDDGQYSDDGDEGDDEGEGSEVEGWDDLLLEEEDDDSMTAGMDTDSD